VPNGLRLLHSTAVGELSNKQFKSSLFRTNVNQDQSALDLVEQFFPEF